MADFTQNITNSVRCFGQGPSTKWGGANGFPYTMTWGVSKWGEGESLPIAFQKVISNSQALTWDYYGASVAKVVDAGSAALSFEMYSQVLKQGDWFYVFTSDTTAGESRDFASWTAVSADDATFTCQAAAGTTWSEA